MLCRRPRPAAKRAARAMSDITRVVQDRGRPRRWAGEKRPPTGSACSSTARRAPARPAVPRSRPRSRAARRAEAHEPSTNCAAASISVSARRTPSSARSASAAPATLMARPGRTRAMPRDQGCSAVTALSKRQRNGGSSARTAACAGFFACSRCSTMRSLGERLPAQRASTLSGEPASRATWMP